MLKGQVNVLEVVHARTLDAKGVVSCHKSNRQKYLY